MITLDTYLPTPTIELLNMVFLGQNPEEKQG